MPPVCDGQWARMYPHAIETGQYIGLTDGDINLPLALPCEHLH